MPTEAQAPELVLQSKLLNWLKKEKKFASMPTVASSVSN
jgi:hypothetical protein